MYRGWSRRSSRESIIAVDSAHRVASSVPPPHALHRIRWECVRRSDQNHPDDLTVQIVRLLCCLARLNPSDNSPRRYCLRKSVAVFLNHHFEPCRLHQHVPQPLPDLNSYSRQPTAQDRRNTLRQSATIRTRGKGHFCPELMRLCRASHRALDHRSNHEVRRPSENTIDQFLLKVEGR